MDAVTAGHAVLLCEGYTVCNQYKGFDADYGWFPGLNAKAVRQAWVGREKECPRGAKFVNHYENHDIATDWRPRAERKYGTSAVDQILVWMFTLDGVPMLFNGNELADADERHSMFGKTPMDWTQLDREPGKSRHALVKCLAELRRAHPALTSINGIDGLVWLDTTAPEKVSAFVRRGGGETLLVVQNWSADETSSEVSFSVPKSSVASYIVAEDIDRDVKGTLANRPLISYAAKQTGSRSFSLGPWGYAVLGIDTP